MNLTEIEQNIQNIIDNFSKEEFIYDLLLAYGISKTSITRLKKGDFNLSKNKGEILYKKKVFFKVVDSDKLLDTIDTLSKDESILKQEPRFIIVTDYKHLLAKDLKLHKLPLDIEIEDLPKHFDFFLPLAGSEVYKASNDNEADRNAAYKMAVLYDLLREENPDIYNSKEQIHNLNIFLSRLLFCYFAEDTGIFKEESIFTDTLAQHTNENGSDTHEFLSRLFERLNTLNVDTFSEYLKKFEYVNGDLFKDIIDIPIFSFKARKILIELGNLQWKKINPDIFGSMIQAVVIDEYRSDLGMHYTSVPNILKLIKPLFLDELYEEFEKSKDSVKKLRELIIRLSKIKFFDPACGSGNFLIITYKEIRLLEIEILKQIIELEQSHLWIDSVISLEQFYGIEIDDFAHEVAILSLWLAEHQMNQYFEEQLEGFTDHKSIIPLKKSGSIIQGNSIRIDWEDVCNITNKDEVYIIGNPPYLGSRNQETSHKDDMSFIFKGIKSYKILDYIACWFYKGSLFIKNKNAKCAFVSTNSICQGEQVSVFWANIFKENIEIAYAYQSFKWSNNAKGNAGVTVVIIGLENKTSKLKKLYNNQFVKTVKNINGYLIEGSNISIEKRKKPFIDIPKMSYGNYTGGCNELLLSPEEKDILINKNINSQKFIRKLTGSAEFIQGKDRYCLWIKNEQLNEAIKIPEIKNRIEKVKENRLKSKDESLQKLAIRPHQFRDLNEAKEHSIIVPIVSSERRKYIPVGFLDKEFIIPNSAQAIYDAEPWIFAIISSYIHNLWVKTVGGSLETRIRYSSVLCYNTFPFPEISNKQKENLNLYVFAILDERAKYSSKTMAELYNPDTMPKGLEKAHQELDEAIEKCYRLQPFKNDTERLEYLFKLYEEMIKKDTLFAKDKKSKKQRNSKDL
ncbi:class I SAM-dependent DNA methyltransferase [Aliarcobacter butzleri]|uniref:class I SAM-dependent DNA methyltransferase n=1 Tax=Aliarcobacter butzleri TaxID=28197 RepID=UPI003AF586AD